MTIDENKVNLSLQTALTKASTSSDDTSSFAGILERQIGKKVDPSASSSTSSTSESDAELEAFKAELKEKGALQFYQDYNFEKIDKLIEKKKAELEDKLGLSADSQPALTGEDRTSALSSLDDMLDAYRKQLQDKMQAEDQIDQKNSTLKTFLQELA